MWCLRFLLCRVGALPRLRIALMCCIMLSCPWCRPTPQIHADDVMKDAFAVRLRRRELDDLEDEYKAAEGAHAR